MSAITSTGLGSGLDIKSLVASLVSAEQTPATTILDTQQTKITTQISAYGSLNSAMATLQGSLSALKNLSTFQKPTAVTSDTSIITATAFSNADQGSYNLEVKQLAKNQTLASLPLLSPTSTVGTGTLTINFGTSTFDVNGKPTGFTQDSTQSGLTLNVDATNNTLVGLSQAINQAKAGITAVVFTDNTGSRLVLNSTSTGAKSSMQINVTDTGDSNDTDTSGLSALAFNVAAANMTQSQTAQDAKLAINGLDIVNSTNTVNTVIKGLSLNLLQAQPGKIVTLGISQNNADIATAVSGFVKSFNDLITTVNPLTSYDTKTKTGGVLLGDATVQKTLFKLRNTLGSIVSGLSGSATSMTEIGISTQKDGTLTFNSSRLNSQLSSNPSGVAGVFAPQGIASNANVVYITNTADTKAGQYAVNITQAAVQSALSAPMPAFPFTVNSSNSFTINIDGSQSGTVALTQKTYATGADLATEMQTRINADSAIKASGASVSVTYDGSNMVLTSKSYGASSKIAVTTDSTLLGLIGSTTSTAGKDVAGTIGGLAATGSGQQLTSTKGDPVGLMLIISDTVSGDKGTVNFSRGLMEQLDNVLTGAIGSTGTFNSRSTSLQTNLTKIATDRTALAARMSLLQKSLLTRFNAMDALLGKMQATSSFLTKQFSSTTSTN